MESDKIIQTLEPVFSKVLGSKITLSESTTAKEVKNWDSLNHILLLLEIEKKYGFKFATHEVSDLNNVGSLIRLIQSKLGSST